MTSFDRLERVLEAIQEHGAGRLRGNYNDLVNACGPVLAKVADWGGRGSGKRWTSQGGPCDICFGEGPVCCQTPPS